ncbi:unnamed protein product [Cylicocyclus nassatus]|uniref:TIL domain-containing protein n=1 Tax=Cylicocyclus nassatus TaxID=53992 RepID=A0AA36MA33_CYLNA|nr:unnamed protein product [Cylicocyclus nassatus]
MIATRLSWVSTDHSVAGRGMRMFVALHTSLLILAVILVSGASACGPNEVFAQCGVPKECEPTCANKSPVCPPRCGPPGCRCIAGYVRTAGGSCMKAVRCPR